MFLFLSTFIPSFLGLSHSCTASKNNPLAQIPAAWTFNSPRPLETQHLPSHPRSAWLPVLQQESSSSSSLRGCCHSESPMSLTSNTTRSPSAIKDHKLDFALTNKSHLQHLQDEAYIHQPKKKICSY